MRLILESSHGTQARACKATLFSRLQHLQKVLLAVFTCELVKIMIIVDVVSCSVNACAAGAGQVGAVGH